MTPEEAAVVVEPLIVRVQEGDVVFVKVPLIWSAQQQMIARDAIAGSFAAAGHENVEVVVGPFQDLVVVRGES